MADIPEHRSGTYWAGLTWTSITIDGAAPDLTDAVATFQVKRSAKDAATLIDWRSDGTSPKITINAGTGTITVAEVDSLKLASGTHVWEMELRLADGREFSIGYGEWPVVTDIVRRTYS